jgi:hypothetical protein
MSLARVLLVVGESAAVLEFLDQWRSFRKSGKDIQ